MPVSFATGSHCYCRLSDVRLCKRGSGETAGVGTEGVLFRWGLPCLSLPHVFVSPFEMWGGSPPPSLGPLLRPLLRGLTALH